jgi:type II secretion system protein G
MWMIVLALVLGLASPLWADTLYLKDGRIVHGEVISETDEVVSVKEPVGTSGYAEARYPTSQVERIERGPTERAAPPAQVAATPSTAPAAAPGPTAEQLAAAWASNQINETVRQEEAKGHIRLLSFELENYKTIVGEFPATQDVMTMKMPLKATQFVTLAEKAERVRLWIDLLKALTLDPWGQPYRYVYPGRHGAFDLFSVGPDGQEDTADDVTSWK